MSGKDNIDLRRCVELLTEMLENEGKGTFLFWKFTVNFWQCCSLAVFRFFLAFTGSDNLRLGLGLGSVLIAGFTSTF